MKKKLAAAFTLIATGVSTYVLLRKLATKRRDYLA